MSVQLTADQIYKTVNGLAPAYSNLLTPYVPSRALGSSDEPSLVLPGSHFKSKGDQAFAVVGP